MTILTQRHTLQDRKKKQNSLTSHWTHGKDYSNVQWMKWWAHVQPMFLQQHAFTTSGHLERFKQCPSMEGVTHIAHGEGPESHTRSESMRNKKTIPA